MTPGFDIFQTEADGGVLWRGAAATLEDAKAGVPKLAVQFPGEYFILNFSTGNKIIISDGCAGEMRAKNSETQERPPKAMPLGAD